MMTIWNEITVAFCKISTIMQLSDESEWLSCTVTSEKQRVIHVYYTLLFWCYRAAQPLKHCYINYDVIYNLHVTTKTEQMSVNEHHCQ